MIRRAVVDDVPRIVAMGLRFLGDVYADKIQPDPDAMTRTALWLLDDEAERALFVMEADGQLTGMLGLFVFSHPISGQRTASELFWWVTPGYRGSGLGLLKEAARWATAAQATTLQMIAPNDKVAAFYKRAGFHAVEASFARSL